MMEDGQFFDVEDERGSGLLPYGVDDAGSCASSGGGSFDMEPLQRGRSNTWHGRAREDNNSTADEENCSTPSTSVDSTCDPGDPAFGGLSGLNGYDADCSTAAAAARKATSRRNAWGNLSYADLITKAIESTPEKRLTLSQIYSWMVTNVPFFRDKGESNSSAGWKNSIRHNLSLHNRFMRVQNEGTGKSSWWVLNPDATHAVKTPRRQRALTMDSKSYERQRRGRGSGGVPLGLGRQGSRGPIGMDPSELTPPMLHSDPIDPFQMEYRVRASSFGGHLSPPLETVQEPDTNDPTDICHFAPLGNLPPIYGDGSETLSETLADIFAGDLKMSSDIVGSSDMMSPSPRNGGYCENRFVGGPNMDYFQSADVYPSQQSEYRNNGISENGYSCMSRYLPSTGGCRNVTAMDCGSGSGVNDGSNRMGMMLNDCAAVSSNNMRSRVASFGSAASRPHLGYHTMSLTELQDVKPPTSCMFHNNNNGRTAATQQQQQPTSSDMTTYATNPMISAQQESAWYSQQSSGGAISPASQPARFGSGQPRLSQAAIARILAERPHLMAKMQQLIKMKREQLAAQLQQHHQQLMFGNPAAGSNGFRMAQPPMASLVSSSSPCVTSSTSDVMSTTPPTSSFFPSDLDLNGLDFSTVDMDCDIDQVIRHEIALDGKLDFMFDGLATPSGVSN